MRARSAVLIGALAASALLLAGCGDDPAPGASPSTAPTTTGVPSTPAMTPTPPPTPTPAPSTAATSRPATPMPPKTIDQLLLTGADVARADAGRGWRSGGGRENALCGPRSVSGSGAVRTVKRFFNNELDASGGQWVSAYKDVKAARTAYDSILHTLKTCPAGKPAATHGRKLTENRAVAAGDATRIVRWYDYPLPSDPGSEDGGFPYAVTRTGTVVSVAAFGEMGPGIKPANFEKLARAAAAKLS